MKILVDDEFRSDMYERLSRAKERVFVQFMTFEGDSAGLQLSQSLLEAKSRGVDVRVVLDSFTDFYVSDTYYRRAQVRDEVAATKVMLKSLKEAGILLVRTRPFGPGKVFFASRNHKKLIIIDDCSYIGGINISEHNYSWHDFMVRFDGGVATETLVKDYESTLRGEVIHLDSEPIISNRTIKEQFFQMVGEAEQEIVISSPYLFGPHLIKIARREGAKLRILTIEDNNYGVANFGTRFLFPLLHRYGARICFYEGFSHAKFVIVDRKAVLFGSSNFCINSFAAQQEIGAYVRDEQVAEYFYTTLVAGQERALRRYDEKVSTTRYLWCLAVSFVIARLVYLFQSFNRIITKTFISEVKP